jgi:hypothetical protein
LRTEVAARRPSMPTGAPSSSYLPATGPPSLPSPSPARRTGPSVQRDRQQPVGQGAVVRCVHQRRHAGGAGVAGSPGRDHRHLPRRGLAEHRAALLNRSRAPYVLFCETTSGWSRAPSRGCTRRSSRCGAGWSGRAGAGAVVRRRLSPGRAGSVRAVAGPTGARAHRTGHPGLTLGRAAVWVPEIRLAPADLLLGRRWKPGIIPPWRCG